jgi:predicted ArsR family transcriptional regulator
MPYDKYGIGYQKQDTSRDARPEAGRAGSVRRRVYDLLVGCKRPLAPDQVARLLDLPRVTVQPRLTELKNSGLIEDSGERGLTDYGKKCILWKVT